MLSLITQEEYENNNKALKLSLSKSIPTSYGKIKGNSNNYDIFFSWSSDLITPKYIKKKDLIFVGIDTKVEIIDITKANSNKTINLDSHFFSFLELEGKIVIVCETEIIIIDYKGNITKTHHLPDIVESYSINGEALDIKCMEGERITIKI